MSFKTIISKKVGTCGRCGEAVPVGTKVRWLYGKGIWHLAVDCPGRSEGEQAKKEAVA